MTDVNKQRILEISVLLLDEAEIHRQNKNREAEKRCIETAQMLVKSCYVRGTK